MYKALGQQLRKPSGFFGKLVSKILQLKNRQFYIKILHELDLKPGDKIFEIGYGPGLGIKMIVKNINDCSISGIDFSELMYKQAVRRNKKYIESGLVNLSLGNFLTAEPDIEKYNKIFCVNVIYFWSDISIAFRKIYVMLKKGGIFCIYMEHQKDLVKNKFTIEFNLYSIDKVESALKEAGFESVEYKLVPGYYIKAKK